MNDEIAIVGFNGGRLANGSARIAVRAKTSLAIGGNHDPTRPNDRRPRLARTDHDSDV